MAKLHNEFSVSKTRIENYNTCLRKYYYKHYGFWGGWERSADPLTRELYALSKLSSRPQWVGTVVHETIDKVIESIKTAHPYTVEEAVQQMKRKMQQQWHNSYQAMQSGWFRNQPKQVALKTAALQEHYYGLADTTGPEDLMSDIAQAERCLTSFYATSIYKALTSGSDVELVRPGDFSFTVVDDIKLHVQIDLMYRRPDNVLVIVDWKTGRDFKPNKVFNQLFTYAVYAVQEQHAAVENIWLCGVDLYGQQEYCRWFEEYWFSASMRTIRRVANEFKHRLVDPTTNEAQIGDFPMTANRRVCSYCAFRRPCYQT